MSSDLETSSFSFFRFPFNFNGKKLRGRMFYVHHGSVIYDYDPKTENLVPNYAKTELAQRGCRPATEDEMEAFFEKYKDLLPEANFEMIVATGTIIKNEKIGKIVVAGILKRQSSGKVVFGAISLGLCGMICGHEGNYVFAIEK